MPAYGWGDYLRHSNRARIEYERRISLSQEKLYRITSHSQKTTIRYPQFKEAFDYVDALYPFAHVRSATVYQIPRNVSEDIGYHGAGGFFDIHSKVIVITDCVEIDEPSPFVFKAEFTPDEVLCHELIHFAANYSNTVANRAVEEEIAYGKSVGYFKAKGKDDDFIIDKVMMPYLMSCIDVGKIVSDIARTRNISMDDIIALSDKEIAKKFGPAIKEKSLEEARRLGKAIIAHNTEVEIVKTPTHKRDLLFDDM